MHVLGHQNTLGAFAMVAYCTPHIDRVATS
jgi:hypothetical protein